MMLVVAGQDRMAIFGLHVADLRGRRLPWSRGELCILLGFGPKAIALPGKVI